MSVEIGICCTLFCNAQLSKHCHQVARDGWRDSLGRAVRLYWPHCGLTLGNTGEQYKCTWQPDLRKQAVFDRNSDTVNTSHFKALFCWRIVEAGRRAWPDSCRAGSSRLI